MNTKSFLVIIMSMFVLTTGVCKAEDKTLSKEEAIALFNDKTFDGHQVIKDKEFRVYSAPDGTHEIHFSGGKEISRYWRINTEGEHSVSKKESKGGRCSKVVNVGDGVYHKVTEGEHTHTLKNFVSGNQL